MKPSSRQGKPAAPRQGILRDLVTVTSVAVKLAGIAAPDAAIRRLTRARSTRYIESNILIPMHTAGDADRMAHDGNTHAHLRRLAPERPLAADDLGDFTAGWRLLPMSVAAIGIGALSAVVALVLLKLIGLFTNLFFFGRWDTAMVSPAGNHLGLLVVAIPVVGALIIGLMARYGSERIRGHGIPEAIEAILINGSRMQPRVALLKPLSSAISIGSGGPVRRRGADHHDRRRASGR